MGVRKIRYSAFPDIPDPRSAKKWLANIQRKKTIDHGKEKLLKIDGRKALYQLAVNRIKKFFGIRPMRVELVFDTESNQFGSFFDWEDHFGTLTQLTSILGDSSNLEEVVKIVIFDAVIGNNDRTSVNLIVTRDFKILGIDEGESFRFYAPIKCRFAKETRNRLLAYVGRRKDWLERWTKNVRCKKGLILTSLRKDKIEDEIIQEIERRLDNLDGIVGVLFKGENGATKIF